MKKIIIALAVIGSSSVFACDFQKESSALVKASDIVCNELDKISIIKNPQINIDGKFYNFGAGYSQKEEFWDTETRASSYETANREYTTVTVEREKKTRNIGVFLTIESRNRICKLFGFSRSVEAKYSTIFSYFKKAYWLDDGKLYQQQPNYSPLEEISCK